MNPAAFSVQNFPESRLRTKNLNRFYQVMGQYLLLTVLVAGSMLIYLYQHLVVMTLSGELSLLREKKENLLEERRGISINLEQLSQGRRIVKIATEELSMMPLPGLPENIFIGPR